MRIDRSKASAGLLVALAAVALFLLVAEHHVHPYGAWWLLLIPLCLVLLYAGSREQADAHVRDSATTPPPSVEPGAKR